ncbi:MAG TPA: HlyD family type I secretion periplasmic adaptor subunit [Xanthobacteraceae bacterium]
MTAKLAALRSKFGSRLLTFVPRRLLAFYSNLPPAGVGRVDPAAVDFQPDAAAIEDRPFPPAARSVVYIVTALIITGILWATFSKVDRVVIARGKLIAVDPVMVVQPLETAVIRTINVGIGDNVKAGAVLATLDPTFTESQETADRERLNSMRAEERRLEAEIYQKPFPADNDASALDPKYLALQTAVYNHRLAEYQASVSSSEADIARYQASLTTNQVAQQGLQKRIGVIGEVESMRKELYAIQAGSRLNLLSSINDRLQLDDQLAEKQYQEKELLQQLAAAKEQKEKYINNWVRDVGEQLVKVQQDISTATDQLTTAERRRSLVVLRAPADGTVLELGQRSIGSVAKEAEPLITLEPMDDKIEAEVDVEGSDVARLRVGDPVRVKLDALPFQQHGTLSGTLRVITENSFQSDKDARSTTEKPDGSPSFFRARIALGPIHLDDVPRDFRLIAGMTTTAEINTGRRSIISYLLDPIVRLFDEGLREP